MNAPQRFRTTSTISSATSFSTPEPSESRRFKTPRSMPPFGLAPSIKTTKRVRRPVFIIFFVFVGSVFFFAPLQTTNSVIKDQDNLRRYSHAAAHFRKDMTKEELEQFYKEKIAAVAAGAANAPQDKREFIITRDVANSFYTKCMLSPERSVLHPSLRRGPDVKELEGRDAARQPRDFDDTFATIDRRRYYFHPDRPAVQTVDALGAGLNTELDDVINVAKAVTEKDIGASLGSANIPIAYMRTTRQDGVQTIVNIGGTSNRTGKPVNIRRMVTVSRGYGGPCEVHFVRPREVVRIHVLLAYSQRPHRLAAFLRMFAMYFHSAKTDMVRIVVSTTEEEADEVWEAGKEFGELTSARFSVITSKGDEFGNFSRAVALREAAKTVPKDEILFLSDADLAIGGNFLQNCRVNVVNGYQVWFPVMFSLYPYGKTLSSRDGLWRRSSYGMACMYKGDFDAVGGFGPNEEKTFAGWGSEDVFLYNRFRDSDKFAVFRTLEPGLQHQWHGKECQHNEHYENCMRTVYMTIGSQEAVARLMAHAKVDISSLTKDALPV